MTQQGILNKVSEEIVNGTFKSREIWLDCPGRYPQELTFQISGGNINIFNNIPVGSEILIEFDLNGRASSKTGVTKRFNTLAAWKVDVIKAAQGRPAQAPAPQGYVPATQPAGGQYNNQQVANDGTEPVDDLPFRSHRFAPSLP